MRLLRSIEILLAAWLALGAHPPESSAAGEVARRPSVRLEGDVEPPRRVPIPSAAARLVREWAGTYVDIGSRLKFESEGTAAFQVIGCMQSPEQTCGRVREAQGRLVVEGFEGPPMQLVPVRWGERRYLVRAEQMERFCLGVNSGWEQRKDGWSVGYVRVDEAGAALQGLPTVPDEFRPLLLDHPIEARVVEVLRPGTIRGRRAAMRVKLDLGAAAGVRAGMKMKLVEPKQFIVLEVESVTEHESIALVPRQGLDAQPAALGDRFTSGVW